MSKLTRSTAKTVKTVATIKRKRRLKALKLKTGADKVNAEIRTKGNRST